MAKTVYPSDKQDQYMVRFPDGMRDKLKANAEKNGRSLNAEIVYRLASSLNLNTLSEIDSAFEEELTGLLLNEASRNERSVKEEIIHRVIQSMTPEYTLVQELEAQSYGYRRKYEDLMELFIQLTPEERRILEERSDLFHKSRKDYINSKFIGEMIQLKPIGKSGRVFLSVPSKRDFYPGFPTK